MRRTIVALTLALGGSMLSAPSAADVEPPRVVPTMAGTTVIHAQGLKGIVLDLPMPIRLYEDSLAVEASPGTELVFALLTQGHKYPGICDFCWRNYVQYHPIQEGASPSVATCHNDDGDDVGCAYQAGEVEIYFVSDGQVTLTIDIPELAGMLELDASGELADGLLEVLPPTEEEAYPGVMYHYGGAVHPAGTDGRDGMAILWVWNAIRRDPQTGTGVKAGGWHVCGFTGAGADPSRYPRGCPEGPAGTPPFTGVEVFGGSAGYGGVISLTRVHGPAYLGYWRSSTGPAEWPFKLWGSWLTDEILCPSNDFTDCTRETSP